MKKKEFVYYIVAIFMTLCVFVGCFSYVGVLKESKQKENDYKELTVKYYEQKVYYETEFAEIETAWEFVERYYKDIIEQKEHYGIVELYVITEEDGDYELLISNQNGWYYEQELGGEIVDRVFFGSNSSEFVRQYFGSHFEEFVKLI